MAKKEPVDNPRAPDLSSYFNWGVKITGFQELFLIAGHSAQDRNEEILYPGDPVAQTRYILDDVTRYLEDNGYARDDIIRVEFTVTKDVPRSSYEEIFDLFREFFASVEVKPAAGTFRVVDALVIPGMMVEYEFWAAR